MMKAVEKFERDQMKKDVPDFRPGDTIRVNQRVREGDRERIQGFEGICIGRKGGGIHETFKVRKVSYGVGVERTFHLHSPQIESIVIKRQGHVRRAKLYYLRRVSGKKARIPSRKRIDTSIILPSEPVVEASPAQTEA